MSDYCQLLCSNQLCICLSGQYLSNEITSGLRYIYLTWRFILTPCGSSLLQKFEVAGVLLCRKAFSHMPASESEIGITSFVTVV